MSSRRQAIEFTIHAAALVAFSRRPTSTCETQHRHRRPLICNDLRRRRSTDERRTIWHIPSVSPILYFTASTFRTFGTATHSLATPSMIEGAPSHFEVVLTNPPFGGKKGRDAQSGFAYKTSSTHVLFLQHVIDSLADGGRAGMVGRVEQCREGLIGRVVLASQNEAPAAESLPVFGSGQSLSTPVTVGVGALGRTHSTRPFDRM